MEICRCEEFREAVKNYRLWTVGTLSVLVQRIPVPDEVRLVMKKTKTSYHDLRFDKPIALKTIPRSVCPEHPKQTDKFPNKWIPVLPGLISLKLVNESRGLKDRPF